MTFRWLVTGAAGQFGSVLLRSLVEGNESALGLVHRAGSGPDFGETAALDILDHTAVAESIGHWKPRFVIHAAAIANAQTAFQDPVLARRTNVEATAHLAAVAVRAGARFTFVSSDLVFDGTTGGYDEASHPNPLSVYGRTKADAEQVVLQAGGVIVRPAIMYGIPAVRRTTVFLQHLKAIEENAPLALFEDQFRSPIALTDAATACIDVTASERTGIFHVAGPERLSRLRMGEIMARAMGRTELQLVATRQSDLEAPEPRPRDVSLACGRFTAAFGRPPGRPMDTVMREIADGLDGG